MKSLIAAAVFCFLVSINNFAQTNVLRELLDLPAPAAVTRPEFKAEAGARPPEFYSKKQVPPDDAPIEELLDYWMMQNYGYRELGYNLKPSPKTAERILEFCEKEPQRLTNFLKILPSNPATADVIKNLFDAQQNAEKPFPGWDYQVKNWLKYNSKYFTDELLKEAQQVKDEKEYIINEKELLALAKIDWDLTLPVIQRLENDKSQPVSSALAKWAFYVHAMDNNDDSEAQKYRDQLKAIVADRTASDGTRDLALDALVKEKDWDGRDDWYISLLADETLFDLRVNGASYTGLTTFMTYSPPEKWAERMINLVGNKNAAIHNAAVRNLFSLLAEKRPDVVVALLPWISNPQWAKETKGYERSHLIEMTIESDVPEAVPHLIWVVANDEENLLSAAQALIRYKSLQAVPTLRLALQKISDEQPRSVLITALIASGGLTAAEQATALETYANLISTPEGKKLIENSEPNYERSYFEEPESKEKIQPLPLNVSIGKTIAGMKEPDDALVW